MFPYWNNGRHFFFLPLFSIFDFGQSDREQKKKCERKIRSFMINSIEEFFWNVDIIGALAETSNAVRLFERHQILKPLPFEIKTRTKFMVDSSKKKVKMFIQTFITMFLMFDLWKQNPRTERQQNKLKHVPI